MRGKERNNLSLNEKIRKLTIFKKELSEAHKNRVLVDRDDVLGLLEGYVAVPRKQLQKSIEDIKVDLLGMFCYQGPPTRHWIETKGQFWKGWNEACDKIIERLLRDDGKRPTK